MIQPRVRITYTVITEIPRVTHRVEFTSNGEAMKFLREHTRWFSATEIDRYIHVENFSMAELMG